MDTIVGMRAFIAVARQQSFTAGAKALNISTKLASKYVKQLEQHLGAQLLNRTTRSVTLTETGRVYFERSTQLLDQFDELEGVIQKRQSELAGSIRITAPTAFGSIHLVEALQSFQSSHPNISIDLHLSDQHIAIVEEGFDLAIRFGKLKDSNLIARKLMSMRGVYVASPDYLADYGQPKHPDELVAHNCMIQRTSDDPHHWLFNIDNKTISVEVSGSFQANSPMAIAKMAVGGLGICMCPMYVVSPDIENGTLKVLFEEYEVTKFNLYAVYPPSRHLTARVRTLIDHLAHIISDTSETFSAMN
ncbi:MAG: LysR family transcriptional regulator [Gammaproteobacteria bacterium]|nr:LysR family transcriptional regulator [Gammaproteobacteria bacterium]